jgi:hypothetical protein
MERSINNLLKLSTKYIVYVYKNNHRVRQPRFKTNTHSQAQNNEEFDWSETGSTQTNEINVFCGRSR